MYSETYGIVHSSTDFVRFEVCECECLCCGAERRIRSLQNNSKLTGNHVYRFNYDN